MEKKNGAQVCILMFDPTIPILRVHGHTHTPLNLRKAAARSCAFVPFIHSKTTAQAPDDNNKNED